MPRRLSVKFLLTHRPIAVMILARLELWGPSKMFKNRLPACALAAAALTAGPVVFPVSIAASEPQIVPASHPRPVKVEPIIFSDGELTAAEVPTLQPARPKAAQGAASPKGNLPRQLAILVILLSTLGVATRLLWRRHLRALSFVQDADVDEEMRSN
ncbi:hypothetical protein [Methyloligella solikamskensis]|uniref:Transmembrane protein n=1 Tax=Methyloligella solikamskensis TaxID=1177756 RepID=A0ABW3J902_9HYPH